MTTEQCEERLTDRGIRPTVARILVLQKLSELDRAVSLVELEDLIETLDKSTIFRSLSVLAGHHAIHSFEDGSGSIKYEMCRAEGGDCLPGNRHVHFFCEMCHRTECITDVKIPVVQLPSGYEVQSINYTIKGLCPHCRAEAAKKGGGHYEAS